jgi:hypothetical protein
VQPKSWESRARRLTQELPAWASTNIDLRPGEAALKHAAQFPLFKSPASGALPCAQQLIAGTSNSVMQWRRQNHRFLAENSEISENTATCFPPTASYSSSFERHALCRYQPTVTLKIEKLAGEHGTTLKLIGRIRAEHLAELRGQIAASAPSVLELREVTLVDAEVVRFLSACESEGIHLQHCSAYIREWIVRERESAIKG